MQIPCMCSFTQSLIISVDLFYFFLNPHGRPSKGLREGLAKMWPSLHINGPTQRKPFKLLCVGIAMRYIVIYLNPPMFYSSM